MLWQALSAVYDVVSTNDLLLQDTSTSFSLVVRTLMALQEANREFMNSVLLPRANKAIRENIAKKHYSHYKSTS